MSTKISRAVTVLLATALIWSLALLTGCGSGGGVGADVGSLTIPPAPQPSQYLIVTSSYFDRYTTANSPFSKKYQFTSSQYPITISYTNSATQGSQINLQSMCENAIMQWAKADKRVAIVSGTGVNNARIRLSLMNQVDTAGSGILGSTRVTDDGDPRFDIQIARLDPTSGAVMPETEIQKIITHELGHALGLGHSSDMPDLMYSYDNAYQGTTLSTYITYGDALTLWTTLTDHLITWYPDRPTISSSQGMEKYFPQAESSGAASRVVCVYTRTP